jgi:hypothetical protein
MRRARLGFAGIVVLLLGCATAESIEEDDGVGGVSAGGATGSGGKGDNPGGGGSGNTGNTAGGGSAGMAGGGTSAGGAPTGGASSGGASSGGASSGGSTAGGGTGGAACPSGKKSCGGVCIAPSPGVGCVLQDNQCAACPSPPANGTSTCNGTLCDFTCNSGYTKSGNACVGSGGGGAPAGGGGSTGSGGGSSSCSAPCDPSDITSQFLCTFYCATITGKPGLCAPVLNCCACPA